MIYFHNIWILDREKHLLNRVFQLTEPMVVDKCAELWYYMDSESKVPRGK